MSLEHSGRTHRWRGFSLCPHHTPYRSGFAAAANDRGPLDSSVPSVLPTLSKKTIKKQAKMHSRCSALPFSLSLILPGHRRTLNLRRAHCLAGVARRVCDRATRSAVSLHESCGPSSCQVLHALQDVMRLPAQLLSLCGLRLSLIDLCNMVIPLAITLGFVRARLILRLDHSWLLNPVRCCVQYVLSC